MLTGLLTTVAVILLVVNCGVFLLYAADKRRAAAGKWRIAEAILLAGAFFGPFGALAAMHIFRHKTQKIRFFLVPLFCLIQILAFLWLLTGVS